MRKFFANDSDINEDTIVLMGDEHLHLAYSLRMRVGDEINISFNTTKDYFCKIIEIKKDKTICKIESIEENIANPKINVVLFQSMIKLDNMELVIQKAVEMGITKIVPFTSEYSQINPKRFNMERQNRIIKEATKQCGRSILTELSVPVSFSDLILELKNFDQIVFANEREEKNKLSLDNNKSTAIIVGCEGGFSTTEIEQIKNLKNSQSITLGKRILRAETASLVLSALVMNNLGEI